ncbi:hypothetical protein SSPO_061210 [Streptomyces antimycoticus]|uniref:Uncharacterized protein n=1 Tax=Streptomyces antimycoticus TaxID=68175 RepID=A0A499UNH2_9ACTN|nr:hypothetical protein SSPO_061210 [Streptomyces antimycoticus]
MRRPLGDPSAQLEVAVTDDPETEHLAAQSEVFADLRAPVGLLDHVRQPGAVQEFAGGRHQVNMGTTPPLRSVCSHGQRASVLARRGRVNERVPLDLSGFDQSGEVGQGVTLVPGEGIVRPVGDVTAVHGEPGQGVPHGGTAGAREQIQ